MQYRKTKNILHVMQKLGHKNIKNTLIYTHLANFESDEYHSTVAKTTEEVRKLVEAGFEYACTTPEDYNCFDNLPLPRSPELRYFDTRVGVPPVPSFNHHV